MIKYKLTGNIVVIRAVFMGSKRVINLLLLCCLLVFTHGITTAAEIAYWPIDVCSLDGSSDEVIDTINGYHGATVGGVSLLESGKFCQAGDFSGSGGHITIPHQSAFEANNGAISLWFNTPDLSHNDTNGYGGQGLFSRDSSGFDGGGHLTLWLRPDGKVFVRHQDTGNTYEITSSVSATVNTWHHVVYTWGDSGMRLYLNNVLVASNIGFTGGLSGNQEPIILGANAWATDDGQASPANLRDFYQGQLDDVRFFDNQIDISDVSDLFNQASYDCISCPEIAYWPIDVCSLDGSVDEVIDVVSDYHGAAVGGASILESGKFCQAGDFSGSGGHIIIPNQSAFEANSGTISLWFNTPDLSHNDTNGHGGQGLFSRDSFEFDGGGHLTLWLMPDGKVFVRHQDTGNSYGITSSVSATVNTWHHVVYTWGGSGMRLYLNNVLVASNTGFTGGISGNQEPIILGANSWVTDDGQASPANLKDFYQGQLDDVRFFDIQISNGSVSNLFNQASYDCISCDTSLVAFYQFEQESWPASGDVLDTTTNGNHGSPVNSNISSVLASDQIACRYLDVPLNSSDDTVDAIDTGVKASTLGNTGTISFWYKSNEDWDSGNARQLIDASTQSASNTDPNKYFFLVLTASGNLQFNLEDKNDGHLMADTDNSFNIAADTWAHVAITWNLPGETMQIVVNGAQQAITYNNSAGLDNEISDTATLYLGDNRSNYFEFASSGNSANGQFDELRLYNGEQTVSQINEDMDDRANCAVLDHYRIEHDTQGFTCEAESMTIKACVNEDCSIPYIEPVSITLSPSGWDGGDTIAFENDQGEITTTLSVTDEGTITLAKTSANPDADLRCFNGSTETCDITFSNDGFEFFGSTTAIKTLGDQEAETSFSNVNIRAVRDDGGVCRPLLEGPQDITFIYNCDDPATCLTPLGGIPINGIPSGDQNGTLSVTFAADGTAPLSMLNYADAGRLALTVAAEIDGVTVTSGTATVEVYPTSLKLDVSPISLLDNSSNYTAGEPFTFTIGAYGALGSLLPNYEAGASELKVEREAPNSIDANEGNFKYGDANASTMPTNLTATFTATSPSPLPFGGGVYSSEEAYYDEVGRIEIDIQDADYLGNLIPSQAPLTLGDFIPAYFTVTQTQPELQDTCGDIFSYIDETIGFVTGLEPLLIFTGKNALDAVTDNYGIAPWILSLSQLDVDNGVSLIDSSTYAAMDSANEVSKGSTPLITTGNADYDGIIEVQIPDTRFKYNKIRSDNTTFDIASPFTASIDMEFSSAFLTDEDGVCYQADYANGTCLPFTIPNITGANMRYGRLALESTYGPETESLNVPIKTEYFDGNQWLINTDDNCTSIEFQQDLDHMILSGNTDITDNINSISSNGMLMLGVADESSDLLLNAPNTTGEIKLQLDPTNDPTGWAGYLNYDWNGDGTICNQSPSCPDGPDDNSLPDETDYPSSTITFGQFRGNDRIIHWREVFN